ncbi:unnamed protein product, partial [Amoebophrya sp. A120]
LHGWKILLPTLVEPEEFVFEGQTYDHTSIAVAVISAIHAVSHGRKGILYHLTLRKGFFVEGGLLDLCAKIVSLCIYCSLSPYAQQGPSSVRLQPRLELFRHRGQVLFIDYICGLASGDEFSSIFTATDGRSELTWAEPTTDATAATAADCVFRLMLATFTLYSYIRCDNGSHFGRLFLDTLNALIQKIDPLHEVKTWKSPHYLASGNWMVEHPHHLLNFLIR